MIRYKLFCTIVFVLFSVTTGARGSESEKRPQCQQLRQFYVSHAGLRTAPLEALIRFLSREAEVFLILDEHSTHETETFGEDLLQSLQAIPQAYRPDCLLIEKGADTEYAQALTKFFKGNDNALSRFPDETRFMRWNGDMKSLVSFFTSLRSLGIKAFPVDEQISEGSVTEILNKRDRSMADNIKRAHDSARCKKSIYSVGGMHALNLDAGAKRKTLYHWLKEFGLKTKIIYLGIAGKLSQYNPNGLSAFPNQNSAFGWATWAGDSFIRQDNLSPLLCRSTLDMTYPSFAFDNLRDVDAPLVYFPAIENFLGMPELGLPSPKRDGFFGRFNDVDLVWIHSCREPRCRSFNIKTRENLLNRGFELY